MTDPAHVAKNHLKIQGVRLLSCDVKKQPRLTSSNSDEIDGTIYSYNKVGGIDYREGEQSDGSIVFSYIFYYGAGLKIDNEDDDDSGDEQVSAPLEVKAVFEAEYISEVQLENPDLEEFSKQNVGYHVWPYWREFVSSSLARMALPNDLLPVPFYFVRSDSEDDESLTD